VILSFVSRFGPCRAAGWLVLVALATVAYGCGSSQQPGASESKGLAKQLNPEDLYRYEGEGQAKRKVPISRRERVKLLHDAANKSE